MKDKLVRDVEVCLEIKKETPLALLVTDGDKECWLPKSLVEMDQDGGPGDTVVFTMPDWLAEKKGLI
jgi:hypothetical protein